MIRERLQDWFEGLDRREIAGLVLVGALVIGAAALWYVRSLPGRVEILGAGAAVTQGALGTSPSPPTPEVLVVHVAGWVRRPGVYELQQGDRVVDAIHSAGGARRGADLATINLAALLIDAQHIVVARRGAAGAPGAPGRTSASTGAAAGASEALININTATADELESLPGIGEVLAQRIVDHRAEHGPFGSIEDLLDVSGIGDKTFEEIRDHVTV